MTTRAEVDALLQKIDGTPFGAEEQSLIREAASKAEELGDDDLLYRVRIRQTTSAHMSGDTEQALGSFTWCVAKHDADPGRFPYDVDNQSLLWQFKWVAQMLLVNPAFSLAQVDQIVADMERRYSEAGVGLSGVWQAKFSNAVSTGRLPDAAQYRKQREAAGTDDYSHCDACVRSDDINYYLEIGDQDEAIRLFDQIIEGEYSCGDEPERAQGLILLSLLRAGRIDDAVSHHQRGLRYAQNNADPLPLVGLHLPFLAVTGNAPKALSLIETYLPVWGTDVIHARSQLEIAMQFGVALDALVALGHGDVRVANADAHTVAKLLGGSESAWTVSTLAEALWRFAEDRAAAFDTRNQTDRYAKRLAKLQSLADENFDVPLYGEQPFQPQPPAAQVSDPAMVLDRATLLRNDAGDSARAFAELAATLDRTSDELRIDYLIALWQLGVELDEPAATSYQAELVAELRAAGRDPEADFIASVPEQTMPHSVDVSAWLDHEDERVRAFALVSAMAQAESPEDYLPAYAAMDQITHPQAARRIANAHINQLFILLNNNQAEAALELGQRIIASGGPSARFTAHLTLGRVAGGNGDFPTGIDHARRAQELALAHGVDASIANVGQLLAQLLRDSGDLAGAIREQRIALRAAELGNLTSHGPILFTLGMMLGEEGLLPDAVEAFEAGLRVDTANGEDQQSLGFDHFQIGMAAQSYDPSRAYRAFVDAINAGQEAEDGMLLTRSQLQLGRLLMRFEYPEGIDLLTDAVDNARKLGEPTVLADCLHALGRAKSLQGEDGLPELHEAQQVAAPVSSPWELADLNDSIGRALLTTGQVSAGVATLLEAADAYASADDQRGAAASEIAAAKALIEAGQPQDAVAAYASAMDRLLGADPDAARVIGEEFADLLDSTGDADRAAALRSQLGLA